VVPVFCFDDRLLHGRHESGPRTQFLIECLADLDGELRARGSGLVIRHGRPERELPKLAREVGADTVHVTQDVSPFARRRGKRMGDSGFALVSHQGLNAVDVRKIETKAGKPYTVFRPSIAPGSKRRGAMFSTHRAGCRRCRRSSRRGGCLR
jgi:deoxyribodipyrimidine photo-lyase